MTRTVWWWFVLGYAIGVQVGVFIGAINQGWRP